MKQKMKNEILIFKIENREIEIRKNIYTNTIWASQSDIVNLYEKDQSIVSRHIKGIFQDGEIDRECNTQKMRIANSDKPVIFYNLDIVLAVGYRINSKRAIEFRKWATKILHEQIAKGFSINPNEEISAERSAGGNYSFPQKTFAQ